MPQPTYEQFAAIRQIGSPKYDPSGTRFAYLANTSGQMNLWLQPADGGFPTQLTAWSDHRVVDFAWSPDGTQIALTADHHGDEMHDIYVLDLDGGRPRRLTNTERVQHNLSGWMPDGRRLVVSANDREPSEVDPQLIDVETGERDRLMTGGLRLAGKPSPDGRWLTITTVRSNTDQDIVLFDLASRTAKVVTEHDGDAKFFPVDWAADSASFYLVTDHGREFSALGIYVLESDTWQVIHAPDHDVAGFELAKDGETTLALLNVDGASRLQAYDMTSGQEIALAELPFGVVHSFSLHPSDRRALLSFGRPVQAPTVVEYRFDEGLRNLEQSMLGGIDPADLREPELITYPSFDRDIPAWLYRPEGDGPFPVVLSIHGGPESQERPVYAYDGMYQYLLSRGIGVLAPNIRGSTGYGKTYQKLIYRDWGGAELEDIRHAAEWLRERPWVDADRLAVYGGSFGGFATLSALSRLPDYWAAGVDVVGPSNLVTFTQSVPPHWRRIMKIWVGDPEEDRDLLVERSPITYVDQIRAPLLVIQGANDPRVVQAESDQMVERLRERGLEVEYYVDPEGGHGASDRAGRLRWNMMIVDYLVDRLTDGDA